MTDSRDVVLDQWGWPKEEGPPEQMTVPHEWTIDRTYGHQVCVRCGLATTVVTPAHEAVACRTPEERSAAMAEANRRLNDRIWQRHQQEFIDEMTKSTPPMTAVVGEKSVAVMTDPVTEAALCPATPDHREGRVCVLCRGKGWIPFQD